MCVAHTCKIALTQTSTSTTVQRWAWHPGFFLFFFHSRLDINQDQDGWSVGASRINHTTSGHSQSMPTRLDWLKLQNKEQCSKSKKRSSIDFVVIHVLLPPNTFHCTARYDIRAGTCCNATQKGTDEPTSNNLNAKKKVTQYFQATAKQNIRGQVVETEMLNASVFNKRIRHWLGIDTHNHQEVDQHVRATILGSTIRRRPKRPSHRKHVHYAALECCTSFSTKFSKSGVAGQIEAHAGNKIGSLVCMPID